MRIEELEKLSKEELKEAFDKMTNEELEQIIKQGRAQQLKEMEEAQTLTDLTDIMMRIEEENLEVKKFCFQRLKELEEKQHG